MYSFVCCRAAIVLWPWMFYYVIVYHRASSLSYLSTTILSHFSHCFLHCRWKVLCNVPCCNINRRYIKFYSILFYSTGLFVQYKMFQDKIGFEHFVCSKPWPVWHALYVFINRCTCNLYRLTDEPHFWCKPCNLVALYLVRYRPYRNRLAFQFDSYSANASMQVSDWLRMLPFALNF